MATSPISDNEFRLKPSLFHGVSTSVGIDRGSVLTKAVYLNRSAEGDTNSDHRTLRCVTFPNRQFEDCLQHLKANADLPTSGVIQVTGAINDNDREKIKKVIGLTVSAVPKHEAMARGAHFLMENVEDRSALFYPDVVLGSSFDMQFPETIQAYLEKIRQSLCINNGPDPNGLMPCVFVDIGATVTYFILNSDGSHDVKAMSNNGGKTLIGMGRAFANAKDYDHLIEMAKAGASGNVDTTMGEVLREDRNSAYGQFPSDMVTFPLGKLVDHDKMIPDLKIEDRAASAVRLLAVSIMSNLEFIVRTAGLNRVVFGGLGIRGHEMRRYLFEMAQWYGKGVLQVRYMRSGENGAIGAMIHKTDC